MTTRARRATAGRTVRAAVFAGAVVALTGCGGTCINGSLDAQGNCLPVETSECVMRSPGDKCLDTGTCNTKQECEIPGGKPTQLR